MPRWVSLIHSARNVTRIAMRSHTTCIIWALKRAVLCVFRKTEARVYSQWRFSISRSVRTLGNPGQKTVGTRPLPNRDSKKVWERRSHAFPQKSTPVCRPRPILCRNKTHFCSLIVKFCKFLKFYGNHSKLAKIFQPRVGLHFLMFSQQNAAVYFLYFRFESLGLANILLNIWPIFFSTYNKWPKPAQNL